MRLENKIAVVTGAGRGIGRATAELFAREGALVFAAEIDAGLARETAAEIGNNAVAVPCDVTDKNSVKNLFALVGETGEGLDILISNAGKPFASTSLAATDGIWDECLNLNLRSHWYAAREAFELLKTAGGSIVNIASTQAFRSNDRSFPYSAAKGGLLALTRNLAVEFAPQKIRVNAIIPGQIESVRTESYFASFRDPVEARRRVLSSFPLGRLGKPEDIAKAALFLASDDAEWMTGSFLTVDGGRDAAQIDLSDLRVNE